jgi:hypothetical protein
LDTSINRGAPSVDELQRYVYESHAGRKGDGDGIYIYIVEEGIQENVQNRDPEKQPGDPDDVSAQSMFVALASSDILIRANVLDTNFSISIAE